QGVGAPVVLTSNGRAIAGWKVPKSLRARHGTLVFAFSMLSAVLRAQADTYGTSDASYYVVDATELSPIVSGNQYAEVDGHLRYWTNGSGLGFAAPLHLPAGAQLLGVILYGSDTSATGETQVSLIVCDNAGELCSYLPGDGCADAPVTVCSGNAFNGGYGY